MSGVPGKTDEQASEQTYRSTEMTSSTTIVGNLTNDPDLNWGSSQKARASFGIAVNHSRRNGDSFEDIGTTFLRVTLWDYHAEQAAEYLRKGDRVMATGHFVTRAFERQDGTEGTSFEMQVQDIGKVLRKRPPKTQQPQNAPQHQQPAADPWGHQPPAQPQSQGWDTPATQPAAWDQGGNQGDRPPF